MSNPTISMTVGLPVYLEVRPDGTVHIEVDLSEVLDDPESGTYYEGANEVTELSEAAVAQATTVLDRLAWTASITIPTI